MQSTINILGVAGSMRADSYSTKALKIVLEFAKKYGTEIRLLDLSKTVLTLRNPSMPVSWQVEEVAKIVIGADAFILASPDYHGSMSGTLKNFLDHFSKSLVASSLALSLHHTKKG